VHPRVEHRQPARRRAQRLGDVGVVGVLGEVAPYAILWTMIVAARAAFSYGAVHWFSAPLVSWGIANHVTAAALTDGLIFMAVVMVLVRTAGLRVRASRLTAPGLAAQNA
jgi:hypothetical protein